MRRTISSNIHVLFAQGVSPVRLRRWSFLTLIGVLALGAAACGGRTASTATLTLHLSGTAPGMPPGDVVVAVPLYPGARRSKATFHAPCWGMPGSPYTKTAQVEFRIPAADATAEAWYTHAFAATQLPASGSGMAGHGDYSSQCQQFGGRGVYGPGGYPPEVEVGFDQLTPDATLVVYHATAVVPPPRAPGSYVTPNEVARVDVTYRPWNWGARRPFQKSVTEPATIAGLAAAVNALPPDAGGICFAAADVSAGTTLAFDLKGGGAQVFTSRPGVCGAVEVAGHRTLWDVSDRLWNAAAALFPGAPQPT